MKGGGERGKGGGAGLGERRISERRDEVGNFDGEETQIEAEYRGEGNGEGDREGRKISVDQNLGNFRRKCTVPRAPSARVRGIAAYSLGADDFDSTATIIP